jgi:phage baseplate assembly protein gpV
VTAFSGVIIALVEDVEDPAGQGRVKVRFPSLPGELVTGWAPIARQMAGKDRGFFYQPEKDDEVLVGFEFGDFNHPFIIGFLHNGVDLPPDDDIDTSVRRFKSVSGHVLDFDDRPGKERIRLETQGGHDLVMDDTAGTVTLETTGGQKIEMKDTPAQIELSTKTGTKVSIKDAPSSVELTTVGGVSVTITDAGGLDITAPVGGLNITCMNAVLNAAASCEVIAPQVTVTSALLTVNSGMAMFSGVVQCSTLITNAVVSASDTPGAGNIW